MGQLGRSEDGECLQPGLGVSASRAGDRWFVVRTVGDQLHLRHVVGAVGPRARARSRHRRDGARGPRRGCKSVQHADGGWGESNDSYLDPRGAVPATAARPSRPPGRCSGLMAAGEGDSEAVRRGAEFLCRHRLPRVAGRIPSSPRRASRGSSISSYHGYSMFFPLWALARYRNHVNAR